MRTLQEKIESNVNAGYSKSYKTIESAKKQVEKANERLDMTLNAMYIALESGRIAVAIYVGHDAHDFMKAFHGTKGWLVFN